MIEKIIWKSVIWSEILRSNKKLLLKYYNSKWYYEETKNVIQTVIHDVVNCNFVVATEKCNILLEIKVFT